MWNNNLNFLYLPFLLCCRECALIKASPKLPFYSRMDTLTDELLQGPHLSSGILVWISSPLALVTMSTHQNWTPSPLIQTAPMCFLWTVLTTWLVGSISLVLCHVTVSVSSIEKDVFEGRTSTRMQKALFRSNSYPESSGFLVSGATRSNLDTFVLLYYQQERD